MISKEEYNNLLDKYNILQRRYHALFKQTQKEIEEQFDSYCRGREVGYEQGFKESKESLQTPDVSVSVKIGEQQLGSKVFKSVADGTWQEIKTTKHYRVKVPGMSRYYTILNGRLALSTEIYYPYIFTMQEIEELGLTRCEREEV